MASVTVWTCDGCGSTRQGDFPAPWRHISVEINRQPDDPDIPSERLMFRSFDLCGECRDRLLREADPTTWSWSSDKAEGRS